MKCAHDPANPGHDLNVPVLVPEPVTAAIEPQLAANLERLNSDTEDADDMDGMPLQEEIPESLLGESVLPKTEGVTGASDDDNSPEFGAL